MNIKSSQFVVMFLFDDAYRTYESVFEKYQPALLMVIDLKIRQEIVLDVFGIEKRRERNMRSSVRFPGLCMRPDTFPEGVSCTNASRLCVQPVCGLPWIDYISTFYELLYPLYTKVYNENSWV
jgi:hypothetical protein